MRHLLKIKNLRVSVGHTAIIDVLNLIIKPGEVHALMGPNGSGKSTIAQVIAGSPLYTIMQGDIYFLGKKINKLTPEARARAGIFLAWQHPHSIAGLAARDFLRTIHNNLLANQKKKVMSVIEFNKLLTIEAAKLDLRSELLERSVNEDFSGGEKKKLEILQMLLLKPKLAIIDEIDSGLDIDALKNIAKVICRQKKLSVLIITHYQRILKYLKPDLVHLLIKGKIVKSGKKYLVNKLEQSGYNFFTKAND
ncbi:MAG: Fe-S cluster assembly ATPase SufC [Patescibacteria group bacterium]